MKFLKNNKGFSLTELMIVVAVMAILVAVAIPVYKGISKERRLDDCAMNRQMISFMVHEAMNGMFDNGKKQDKIDMTKVPETHKIAAPQDFPEGYRGRDCFMLIYEPTIINGATSGDALGAISGKEVDVFTLGDVRGGYRTAGDYAAGCESGFFLKRQNLANVKMYTKLANAEIPQCAFEEPDDTEYHYYIFDDGTVLCDCPECLATIEPITNN